MTVIKGIISHPQRIWTLDTGYHREQMVASHLLESQGHYALIDVGTSSCLDTLWQYLSALNIDNSLIDYVIVTHVHLDHAGAAGSLLKALPNAKLIVHPRGARHMIDPSRLIAGAQAVYGDEGFQQQFGDVLPVPAEKVIEADDQFRLDWRGREWVFIDTPGHARHHFCVYDQLSSGIFSGDTFGVSYPPLSNLNRSFMMPTTTPIQFDPTALHASIDKLMAFQPKKIFLTHYGVIQDPQAAAQQLHQRINDYVDIAETWLAESTEPCEQILQQRLTDYLLEVLNEFDCQLDEAEVLSLMTMDMQLNAQGLCFWLNYDRSR